MGSLAKHEGHTLKVEMEHNRLILNCITCGSPVLEEANLDNDLAKKVRDLAREEYKQSDDVEVDFDAPILMNDDGCWVQGWLWLYRDNFQVVEEGEDKPAPKAAESEPEVSAPCSKDEIDLIQNLAKNIWGLPIEKMSLTDLCDADAFTITLAQVLVRHLKKSAQGGK